MNAPYTAMEHVPGKNPHPFIHAGLITAAGASRRMGQPKALLRLPDNTPLALYQSRFLKRSGCRPVIVVLGSEAGRIAPELAGCRIARNTRWAAGRLTSIQAGLQALEQYDGCFIMPVDAVGIRPETVRRLREAAETGDHPVIRPTHEGTPGHLVWIARAMAEHIQTLAADGDTPLKDILAPHTKKIAVDDPAILRNINTPEAWAHVRLNER